MKNKVKKIKKKTVLLFTLAATGLILVDKNTDPTGNRKR